MVSVAAIIDTRNIRGLAGSILGFPRNPTTQGLDAALSRYGFAVAESFFSVALPRASDRQHLGREAGQNEKYVEYLKKDDRVVLLEGSLRRYPDGSKEEKLVDVLCAIEVVRQAKRIVDGDSPAEAVILLSQDIDLKPGAELAVEFGVPVLVASPGAIHNRGVPFIAISEPPLAEIVGMADVADLYGQDLRQALARAAEQPRIDSWEYRYTKRVGKENLAVFQHRHGYEGVADEAIIDNPKPGQLYDLGIIGIVTDLPNEFPKAELGLNAHRSEDLIGATVVGRYSLFSARVGIHGTSNQVFIDVPNYYLTPETQVLLQDRGQSKPRLIGAVEDPPPLVGSGGVEMPAISVVATVTEHRGSHAVGTAPAEGVEVFIPSGADKTEVGARYVVSLVGSGRDPGAPFVAHLASTRLP